MKLLSDSALLISVKRFLLELLIIRAAIELKSKIRASKNIFFDVSLKKLWLNVKGKPFLSLLDVVTFVLYTARNKYLED